MYKIIRTTVRDLRKSQTKAEEVFWQVVRNRKIKDRKIIRQFGIIFSIDGRKRFFIADFYCHECKLIIEIDGAIHENQKEHDEMRTYVLNNLGYKVVRFQNDEVLNDIKGVIKKLKECL